MKKSIVNKINYLLAISLIILTFFMITANLVMNYRGTRATSEVVLRKSCENQAYALNSQIKLIEQSVNNVFAIAESIRPDIDVLRDETKALEYTDKVKEFAVDIAQNTDGVVTVYYRINPDITLSGTTGFFFTKNLESGIFEATEITDLSKYDVNDLEHVGWYYTPVWAGKPVWMDPYYNANIDVEMISYIIPIYDGPYLVGVLGMDIDFAIIKSIAEDINIYKSAGAVLCSMNDSKFYYDKCDLLGESVPSDIYSILQGGESAEGIIDYTINDKKYCMYYVTLANRMKLLIYAKRSEIYAQMTSTALYSMLIFLFIFSVTLIFSLRIGRKIINPIKSITAATIEYSDGNWDTKVSCDTDDELQLLAENISIMADKTKEYIGQIQEMAQKDGLTGLRNKGDYMRYLEMIEETYENDNKPYSVVVFDVNNLKYVNDNFGHEKGDELIVAASNMICKYFSHSPVFRVGGDEFVAIVDNGDYDNRIDIFAEFQKYMDLSKNSSDIMDVCIASGMADSVAGLPYNEVFDMADHAMYENKAKLKGSNAIR